MRNNALLLESNIATAIVTELTQCTCTVWVTAFTWIWNARCSELTLRIIASSCHTFQCNRFNSSSHIMIFLTYSRAYTWLHTLFDIHWTERDTESVRALKCSAWAEVLVQPFLKDWRKHLDTKQQLTLHVKISDVTRKWLLPRLYIYIRSNTYMNFHVIYKYVKCT